MNKSEANTCLYKTNGGVSIGVSWSFPWYALHQHEYSRCTNGATPCKLHRAQSCTVPWRREKQLQVSGARSHAPPDGPRTSPLLLPHRSSSLPPCWRGCERRQRWSQHTGVWAAERERGEKLKKLKNLIKLLKHIWSRLPKTEQQALCGCTETYRAKSYLQVSALLFWGCQRKLWPRPSPSPPRYHQLEPPRLVLFHSCLCFLKLTHTANKVRERRMETLRKCSNRALGGRVL